MFSKSGKLIAVTLVVVIVGSVILPRSSSKASDRIPIGQGSQEEINLGDGGASSDPTQEDSDCGNGLRHDNGVLDKQLLLKFNSYAQKFTPPYYPYPISQICVCYYVNNVEYWNVEEVFRTPIVSIYDDNGPNQYPSSQLYSTSHVLNNEPTFTPFFHNYESDYVIEEGSIYIGVTGDYFFLHLCIENTPEEDYVAYARSLPYGAWSDFTPIGFPGGVTVYYGIRAGNGGGDDGRLNDDPAQAVAVYCNSEYIDLYAIDSATSGHSALRVFWEDIDAIGVPDDENVLIAEAEDIRLYRLTTGELQVNAPTYDAVNGYDYNGYTFTWSGCEAE